MLEVGSVSHNHFFFYPDAIEVSLDIGNWDGAEHGEFNRSSQHVQFDWPASTGPELRREFSIRGSCGAVY